MGEKRPRCSLAVFGRPATPGRTKTRLIPVLGEAGAARLYRGFVLDVLAQARAVTHGNIKVVHLEDYTNILLRTAFIPHQSQKSQQAGKFLNFLLSSEGQVILEKQGGLPSIFNSSIIEITNAKPIGLNTGLLVYLDRLKRENFLREWNAALVQ